MEWGKYLLMLLMLAISFLGTALLVTELSGIGYLLEIILLVIFLLLGFFTFYGMSLERDWANGLASFYFGIVLINLIILIFPLEVSLTYTATIIVTIIGFGTSLTFFKEEEFGIEEPKISEEMKMYEEEKPKVIVEDLKPAKKAKPRKKSATAKKKPRKTIRKKK